MNDFITPYDRNKRVSLNDNFTQSYRSIHNRCDGALKLFLAVIKVNDYIILTLVYVYTAFIPLLDVLYIGYRKSMIMVATYYIFSCRELKSNRKKRGIVKNNYNNFNLT